MTAKNLLVELFVEELPPKALKKLGEAFGRTLFEQLGLESFLEPDSTLSTFASPRRIAAHLTSVRTLSEPKPRPPEKLMPASVGLDAFGGPTEALKKKLRARFNESVDIDWLVKDMIFRASDGTKDVLMLRESVVSGVMLPVTLEGAVLEAIHRLPIPKVMQYQLADGWSTVHFVRPAHGLVALHGSDIVPVSALGLQSGRTTHGHRFEAPSPTISLLDADSYAEQLRTQGAVIASFAERRAELVRQLGAAAAREGLKPIDDEALLDEVTALVERPNVLLCQFEPEFLAVPPECLILTMKANQKYFPLLDGEGKLTNKFLVVSNIRPADPSRVIEGNERVVRPRLADAKFFFDQDRKKKLDDWASRLDRVVYHAQLGNMGQRTDRVQNIARKIGEILGGAQLSAKASRAASVAKADLLSDMVGEFPELQGVMGGYYARHGGDSEEVAQAVEDHYKPRFAGDDLPRGDVGLVVALSDKLETLAGLFGIGQLPTGDKDPFALRRHALGVIRMLIEREVPIGLIQLITLSMGEFPNAANAGAQLTDFIYERLRTSLRDAGYSANEVEAVIASRPDLLAEVPKRVEAVHAFAALPEAPALAAANKRVGNILKKSEGAVAAEVNPALLREPAEAALFDALGRVAPQADAAFHRGDYTASLQALAALKTPVDAFFDTVMVNADDPALRNNRLALLARLHAAMNRVADLSRLAA